MLKTDHVSYRVKNREILSGVSFTAAPGHLVAVLGPNGAGKSTLVKLLSKELAPAGGQIAWKGRNLAGYTELEMARQRAVLTQNIFMSNSFACKEVALMGRYPYFETNPAAADWQIVEDSMRQTATRQFAERSYLTLSGGEKQRVQFARALAQAHVTPDETPVKLLLLDEPLNNLDIKHQHSCMQLAKEYAQQGNVVLIVMHDLNLAALYADQVLLLKNGRQVAYGSPEAVLTPELLVGSYDMPVRVEKHPYHNCPAIYFGCPALKSEPDTKAEAVAADRVPAAEMHSLKILP